MSAAPQLVTDLTQQVNEAVERASEPLRSTREMIQGRLDELHAEARGLEAQLDRLNRFEDALKLRKRAGRPAGRRKRQEQQTPTPA